VRCDQTGAWCVKVIPEQEQEPENLVALCSRCVGGRRAWTPDEVAVLRAEAERWAPMIYRMTGWGLTRPPAAPLPAGRPAQRPPGRPRKAIQDRRSVRVVFRLTPDEAERLRRGRARFDLNEYSRLRTLALRKGHGHEIAILNRLGAELIANAESIEAWAWTVEKQCSDPQLQAALRAIVQYLSHVKETLLLVARAL
jgi:hypothetical protein